jgi:hypothetical protein
VRIRPLAKWYDFWVGFFYWFAYRVDDGTIVDQSPVRIPDTGNELHDRTTLTIACIKAEQEKVK